MHIDQFLENFFNHNTAIIESLIGLILITIIFLSIRAFFKKDTSDSSSPNLTNIEATLKKILESGAQSPAATKTVKEPAAPAKESDSPKAAAGSGELEGKIAKLDSELKTKEELIKSLEQKLSQNNSPEGAVASSEDKKQLETQIKDLQAKLSEYEIIEQDIADLSFFKDENAKLQKQLEELKSGAAPTAAVPSAGASAEPVAPEPSEATAQPAEETPAPAAAEPKIIEKEKPAAEPVVVEPASVEVAPAEEAPKADYVDDNLMKEFAAAVEDQKAQSPPDVEKSIPSAEVPPVAVTPEVDAAPSSVEAAPAAEEAPVATTVQTDKIPVEATASEPEAAPDLGVNMDKMLSEAADISAVDTSSITTSNVLEENLDTEKLLSEASQLDEKA